MVGGIYTEGTRVVVVVVVWRWRQTLNWIKHNKTLTAHTRTHSSAQQRGGRITVWCFSRFVPNWQTVNEENTRCIIYFSHRSHHRERAIPPIYTVVKYIEP